MRYQQNGCLVPGIHDMTLHLMIAEFGFNRHRMRLIGGLKHAILHLKTCGCRVIYIDGSFVTRKPFPNDYDACWDPHGMDLHLLQERYPALTDFSRSRARQKQVYGGEWFPMTTVARFPGEIYLHFFQQDRDGSPKGVVKISIS